MDELKRQHDELLKDKSDEDSHDEANCPFCNPTINDTRERGEDIVDTFTKEQLEAAVEAAKTPILDELKELKASLAATEVEDKIAAVKAEADEKIAQLQRELDEAELKAGEAEKTLADTVAYLESADAEAKETAAIESRKADRFATVKEATTFTDEQIEKRIDDLAKLSDEDFAAKVEEWTELLAGTERKTESSEEDKADKSDIAMKTVRHIPGKDLSFIDKVKQLSEKADTAGVRVTSL